MIKQQINVEYQSPVPECGPTSCRLAFNWLHDWGYRHSYNWLYIIGFAFWQIYLYVYHPSSWVNFIKNLTSTISCAYKRHLLSLRLIFSYCSGNADQQLLFVYLIIALWRFSTICNKSDCWSWVLLHYLYTQ